ncbi:MAG: type II secretion system F family protein [Rickettsiales bacterium]
MPLYAYSALNDRGRRIRGSMSAETENDLETKLGSIDLALIECKPQKGARAGMGGGRVTGQDLVVFCIHLEQLEQAGIPILEAMSDLRDSTDNGHMKSVLTQICDAIRSGKMLSEAMALHPKIFNKTFIALIEAGEKSGNLHESFSQLAKHLKWTLHIQKKIRKATYYPAFLLVLMTGIISLMMLFVIPKLSVFLKAQDFDLPMYTKALIATSEFFANDWYIALPFPFLLWAAIKIAARLSEDVAYKIDVIKLHIPFIGATIKKIELSRFCHFFGIMYKSGIGLLDCIDSAANVVKNRVISESVSVIKRSIADGNSLTFSLKASNQFPNLVVRMFKVGEESGNLEVAVENINFFYDREVEDSVNNMIAVIQPALTLVMGGIMLWVSMAVFGPLYNSFSKMNF